MADSEKIKLRIAQIEAEHGGEAPDVETATDALRSHTTATVSD